MNDLARPRRGLPLTAIVLFAIAYVAVVGLMLAPRDMFSATPGSLAQPAD
ncbi:MAG: hypothetical protein KBF78_03600 [Fuscovulum sp.]|jgi:hypothetical protein|nr:hypothetical protein [Fuscovulum sp.]